MKQPLPVSLQEAQQMLRRFEAAHPEAAAFLAKETGRRVCRG